MRCLPEPPYVYGALSEDNCGEVDPIELIFHEKTVTGFYLGKWLSDRGTLGILRAAGRVQQLIADGRIETRVQRCIHLNEAVEGLKQYVNNQIRTTMVPYVEGLSWQSFYRNFADHLASGVPLVITPELAKATIQCIHGCETASKENRAVEVEFDFE